jgi:hypothetical protein
MESGHQRNCKITRRTVLNAGIALATAASASPLLQQPAPPPGRGPAKERRNDPPFKTPTEPVNSPLGTGKGIHPGRVAWAHDPKAAVWDGQTGSWWEDANTDQRLVSQMVSHSLQSLTGDKTDKQAWNSLFKFFNQTRKLGNGGYRPGEKIVIKLNSNQDRPSVWRPSSGMPSPHVVYSVVQQLITVAGVRGEDIIIYDAARYLGDPIYNRVRANKDPNFQTVGFTVNPTMAGNGRAGAVPDKANPVKFSRPGIPTAYLPQCVTGAKYILNLALARPHELAGMTATAKNHFGSIYFEETGFLPRPVHDLVSRARPIGSYNCLVDLIAHKHLGGKTLLYMVDFLYVGAYQNGDVHRYKSFGDHWCASVFASQDPVAIDSVALDFIRNEPNADECRGIPENYLHEAALAEKAPSGTSYDPSQEGKPVGSLGVHEHWNSATDKKYSRNLGKREGIELVV